MTSPLYNSRGTWSATVPYSYLDAVTYGKFTYICTALNSVNQQPNQNTTVWVQMPVVTQEDQYYLRSRENLLQYEDARYQSLVNAMANFYTMRNDQSIWGSFLRAIAMELARIEYMYSYDVVAKNPQYLTPPDIKREYADSLFVAGNFQQLSQFDSGSFGDSFGQWAGSTGVILRTAILDSNGNIQIANTAGVTGSTEPSWALTTGATTTDGSVVWTNGGSAPPTLAYPIGYRDMLVDLLAAYQEGATAKSIQDVIYAYTGKNIVVEELYKQIVAGGFYDQSDRNAVKVSVNVGGDDPLVDVQSLEELQQITNSLYGAIDLAKPAHVGLEFTTVFGSDDNIDCFISPRYLTQTQLNTLTEKQKQYYSQIGTLNGEAYYQDLNCTGAGIDDILRVIVQQYEEPPFNPMLYQAPIVDSSNPSTTLASNGRRFLSPLSVTNWASLSTNPQIWSAFTVSGSLSSGNLTLNETVIQNNTGASARLAFALTGLLALGGITSTANATDSWVGQASGAVFIPTSVPISTTYSKGDLVRGRNWTTANGWKLYRALKKSTGSTGADPLTNSTYWTQLPSPSVYQAYYFSNGQYVLGIQQWAKSTTFYTGQFMIDGGGNLQIALTGGQSAPVATIDTTQQNEVVVSGNSLTIKVVTTSSMGLQTADTQNPSRLTLLGYSGSTSFLNGLTLPVTAFTSNTITMSIDHPDFSSGGLSQTGTAQTGFNSNKTGLTYDGGIVWQNLGANYLTNPTSWIQVVDSNNNLTGEVANWDTTHPMGLLAPRTDLVWEIGGSDTFNSYEE